MEGVAELRVAEHGHARAGHRVGLSAGVGAVGREHLAAQDGDLRRLDRAGVDLLLDRVVARVEELGALGDGGRAALGRRSRRLRPAGRERSAAAAAGTGRASGVVRVGVRRRRRPSEWRSAWGSAWGSASGPGAGAASGIGPGVGCRRD